MWLGVGDVLFAKAADRCGVQLFQHAGVARRVEIQLASLQFVDDALNVGQFLRPFDQRMAGEDLLDQRRARARQAKHEDRRRIGDAPAVARGKEGRRADPALLAGVGFEHFGDVAIVRAVQVVAQRIGGP